MALFPPEVRHELPGWELFWADLEFQAASQAALASLRAEVGARAPGSGGRGRPPQCAGRTAWIVG
jgi:hypothetical protein